MVFQHFKLVENFSVLENIVLGAESGALLSPSLTKARSELAALAAGDLMREEARARIEAHFDIFAKWMRDSNNIDPELIIREGEPVKEILSFVTDNPDIGILVLSK